MRSVVLPFALAAVLVAQPLLAQSAVEASTGRVSASPAVVLGPGDAVRITVWQKPELSGEFQIGGDSTLADPFYMDIKAAGVPFPIVVENIRTYLQRFETAPRVLVEPLLRVAVSGEVRQPNVHTFNPATTVSQAVLLAGGPTDRARLKSVQLLRGGQTTRIDLTRPQVGEAQTLVRSGDLILVGRSTNVIRDYVAPVSSILGAVVSVAYVITRYF